MCCYHKSVQLFPDIGSRSTGRISSSLSRKTRENIGTWLLFFSNVAGLCGVEGGGGGGERYPHPVVDFIRTKILWWMELFSNKIAPTRAERGSPSFMDNVSICPSCAVCNRRQVVVRWSPGISVRRSEFKVWWKIAPEVFLLWRWAYCTMMYFGNAFLFGERHVPSWNVRVPSRPVSWSVWAQQLEYCTMVYFVICGTIKWMSCDELKVSSSE